MHCTTCQYQTFVFSYFVILVLIPVLDFWILTQALPSLYCLPITWPLPVSCCWFLHNILDLLQAFLIKLLCTCTCVHSCHLAEYFTCSWMQQIVSGLGSPGPPHWRTMAADSHAWHIGSTAPIHNDLRTISYSSTLSIHSFSSHCIHWQIRRQSTKWKGFMLQCSFISPAKKGFLSELKSLTSSIC